jgi:hypothetical protein
MLAHNNLLMALIRVFITPGVTLAYDTMLVDSLVSPKAL